MGFEWINGWATQWLTSLGEVSLRASILLGAAWALCRLLWKSPAALRHMIWFFSVTALVAVPLLIEAGPKLRLPSPWPGPDASSLVDTDEPILVAGDVERLTTPAGHKAASERPLEEPSATSSRRAPLDSSLPALSAQSQPPKPASLLFTVWAIGVLLFLVRLVAANLRLRQIARGARRLAETEESDRSRGQGREVRFLTARSETMPMTWGWKSPIVLLPASFQQWQQERRDVTIAHELAHVRRADWLTQTAAHVVVAFYWFHPLAWLALKRIRIEADRACDDMVLLTGIRPSRYADHLLNAAREFRKSGLRPWVAIAMALPSSLDQRVRYMLDAVAAIVVLAPSVEAVGQTDGGIPNLQPAVRLAAGEDGRLIPEQGFGSKPQESSSRPRQTPLTQARATPVPEPLAQEPEPTPLVGDALQELEDQKRVFHDRVTSLITQAAAEQRQAEQQRMRVEGERIRAQAELLRGQVERAREQMKHSFAGRPRPELSPEALETAAAALRKALGSPDSAIRIEAAQSLGLLGASDEETLEALSAALSDSEPRVQVNAARALGRLVRSSDDIAGDRAVQWLKPGLQSSNPQVRRVTVEAVGRLSGPEAIASVTPLASDTDSDVQREALRSLGRLLHSSDAEAARSALPVLQQALNHEDPQMRRQLVATLGGLRSIANEVVPLLAKAAEDPDPEVQKEAVQALGRLSAPGGAFVRGAHPFIEPQAWHGARPVVGVAPVAGVALPSPPTVDPASLRAPPPAPIIRPVRPR